MKTSNSISFSSSVPSLFQIAAFFEDFFPGGGRQHSTRFKGNLPFADFMVNPEKLMTLLKSGTTGVQTAIVADQVPNQVPAKRGTPMKSVAQKKLGGQGPEKPNPSSGRPVKQIEFTLKSASARSVKLAGDFTNWEKSPVEMMHSRDDVWSAVVTLEPGLYSYRFIVDGQWCNDPHSDQRVPNPFGGENAVIRVT